MSNTDTKVTEPFENKPMSESQVDYYAIQAINNFTQFTRHLNKEDQKTAIHQLIRVSELTLRCLKYQPDSDPDKLIPIDVLLALKEIKSIYEKNFAVGVRTADGVH